MFYFKGILLHNFMYIYTISNLCILQIV